MKDDFPFSRIAPPRHLAVLVDGDNLSAQHSQTILEAARAYGSPDVRRVYGDATRMPKWVQAPAFRLCHSGSGKNATDMLLTVDAMELALTGQVDGVVIASSDRDFAHLAHRLRERGLCVIGMGEAKTPDAFRAACTSFSLLLPVEVAVTATDPTPAPPAVSVPPPAALKVAPPKPQPAAQPAAKCSPISALDRKVREIIAAAPRNEGVLVQILGTQMGQWRKSNGGVTLPKVWRRYLAQRPHFYTLDPKGNNARVRLS